MCKIRFPPTPRAAFAGFAIALAAAAPQQAAAQYIGRGPPPPLPAAPLSGQVESPAAALARAVRTLAQSPRDFPALINAGHAALDLGDTQAAIGFFGRAEEVRPADPSPKIGMGAATVADGDAAGALRWFYQAQSLGATAAAMGADRGLAQDLLGNQPAAQADYRAALVGIDAVEARRRLALSLGISGDRTGAFAMLQPLLQRQDPAAQRIRAFVLALVGDERGASSAIDLAMPGSGGRMAGFFRLLPSLTAPQKAAAVHLGVFPDPSQIRVAAVSPTIIAPPVADNRSRRSAPARTSAPVSRPVSGPPAPTLSAPTFTAVPANPAPSVAVAIPSAAQPDPVRVTASAATPVVGPAQPGFTAASDAGGFSLPSERASPSAASPAPAAGDRLSGIDRLLAQADGLPVPPAPQPRFENAVERPAPDRDRAAEARRLADAKKAAAARKDSAKKVAEAMKLAEATKLADAKKAAEAKKLADEKREREAIGLAGTHWVQLAGGANEDRMGTEFRRLAAKSSALRRKGGAVTSGKDYFRLLTGPFASKGEAQAFVNQLARDDVDGFSWTRTPAGIRIEKIAPR